MKNHGVPAIALALAFCGCAHTDAPPIATYYPAATHEGLDTIGYGTLRRVDFKATAPPNEGKGMTEAAAAALVAEVRVAPGSEFSIVEVKTEADSTVFEATAHHLRFHAIMDRSESWWRSELDSIATAEVLEHEQIHFAIFELAARDLNGRMGEVGAGIRSTGVTIDEARSAAHARLEKLLQASNEKAVERQSEFDQETSHGMDRRRQKEWWDGIQAELAASASR